ncbi:MAG: hypothetical protein ACYS22_05270 [Planctomycetota bacterium]|jgi:hypothetical protein
MSATRFALAGALIALVALAPTALNAQDASPAPTQEGKVLSAETLRAAFPLATGKRYVYRKTSSSLLSSTKRTELTRTTGPSPSDGVTRFNDSEGEYLDLGLEGGLPAIAGQSNRERGFTETYTPPLPLFAAGTEAGVKTTFRAKVSHDADGKTTEGKIEREVSFEGEEAITVPAGSYENCLRFQAKTFNRPGVRGNFTATLEETVWLAPGVGEVKNRRTIALASFGVTFLRAAVTLELKSIEEVASEDF